MSADDLREALARWLFERDYRERGLASPEDAPWDEWVERNQEDWRQESDALLAGPLAPLLAERDELRSAAWALNAEVDTPASQTDAEELASHVLAMRVERDTDLT